VSIGCQTLELARVFGIAEAVPLDNAGYRQSENEIIAR
jgi:hypothetical protein